MVMTGSPSKRGAELRIQSARCCSSRVISSRGGVHLVLRKVENTQSLTVMIREGTTDMGKGKELFLDSIESVWVPEGGKGKVVG